MSEIKWLHISDLHFGYQDNTVRRLREEMIGYLKKISVRESIQYIFVTGDIRYGKAPVKKAYEDAEKFLTDIRNCLNLPKDKIFIVPGNHDVIKSEVRSDIVQSIRTKYRANVGKIDDGYLNALKPFEKEYSEFYQRICGREYNKLHYVITDKINILHLNSALVSDKSIEDAGKLVFGMDDIDAALKTIEPDKPTFALVHHSFEWIKREEREKLEIRLKKYNTVLYLCGHVHKSRFEIFNCMNLDVDILTCLCATNMDKDDQGNPSDMGFFTGHMDADTRSGEIKEHLWDQDYETWEPGKFYPFPRSMHAYVPNLENNPQSHGKNTACSNTTPNYKKTGKSDILSILKPASKKNEKAIKATHPLLETRAKAVNHDAYYKFIKGKVCLVTGGGGTIGSEICRQIVECSPEKLISIDINEQRAYELQQELIFKYGSDLCFEACIASVLNFNKMDKLFSVYNPQVIFHCAAYKNVAFMENNPDEAVITNINGTYNMAFLADKYHASNFILLSTDKAVVPISIMGTTMRFSEMVLQHFSQISEKTKYSAVRFGNVVESQGSVIPLFKKQIEAGGPVTVTHPEITRYFMTIPEAVSLVLEASADASGREIYRLDMGKPVKIYALAIDMIKSYGLRPDKDIKIVFTGLRPGEKLYEELLLSNAGIDETSNEKISKMTMKEYPHFMEKYNEIIRHAQENNKEDVTNCLKAFVQSFSV